MEKNTKYYCLHYQALTENEQEVIQGQFLSWVFMVLIKSFPSPEGPSQSYP